MIRNSTGRSVWQPKLENASVVAEFYQQVRECPDAVAVRFLDRDLNEETWTRAQVWTAAGVAAARLDAAGVRPGDVCAILLPFRADVGAWYWGIARLGAIPALLAYPSPRLHPEKFRQGLHGVAQHSGLDVILTDSALRSQVEPLVKGGSVRKILSIEQITVATPARARTDVTCAPVQPLARPAATNATDQSKGKENHSKMEQAVIAECTNRSIECGWESHRFHRGEGDDLFLLQHSSGTTGLQKAVALSNNAILKQLAALSESLELVSAEDVIVSWLPLYHDMGLIAAWLLPFLSGTPHIQLSPLDWVAQPELLLKALSRYRGTIGWLPNFAYNLMAGRVSKEIDQDLDLSPVRRLINCSEPVRAASHDSFLSRFMPCGLRPEALAASYALAENVFAVTQTSAGEAPRTLAVQQRSLQENGRILLENRNSNETIRVCVSSGRPVRGSRISILDEQNRMLGEGLVGEVSIHSPYLFDGYRRNKGVMRPLQKNGWFATGDLGFVLDGELFVVGRKKDLLIVRGKNLFPEDIEDCAGSEPDMRAGRVCAWGEYVESMGTEAVMLLAETALEDPQARKDLSRRVRQKVQRELDVFVQRVHLVAPRWLVKSSAGKMARRTNVERWKKELAARRKATREGEAPAEPKKPPQASFKKITH